MRLRFYGLTNFNKPSVIYVNWKHNQNHPEFLEIALAKHPYNLTVFVNMKWKWDSNVQTTKYQHVLIPSDHGSA